MFETHELLSTFAKLPFRQPTQRDSHQLESLKNLKLIELRFNTRIQKVLSILPLYWGMGGADIRCCHVAESLIGYVSGSPLLKAADALCNPAI